MPSQYEYHLLPQLHSPSASLLSLLRRRSSEAERQVLQEYNKSHPTQPPVPLPPTGAGYAHYDPVHLGLLWHHVRNLEALTVLAGPLWSQCSPPPLLSMTGAVTAFYHSMPVALLRRLWAQALDASSFRELLRRGDPTAVRDLIERCSNLSHLLEDRLDTDHLVILALLWSIAGNADALDALARRELGTEVPRRIDSWPTAFLERLWTLARDGSALSELWRREGIDVHAPITSATPARVLGYRWCFLRDELACQELVRRYRRIPLPAAVYHQPEREKDHQGERVLRVLLQVREWDFRVYPDLVGWLCTVERNARIDQGRRGRNAPLPAFGGDRNPIPDPEDARGENALRAIDRQDELDVQASWREVVVLKLKDRIHLSDREVDRVVRDNLEWAGVDHPSAEQLLVERAAVCQAIEALRTTKKKPVIQAVLKRFKPVRHSQLKRIAKLRLLHDVASAAIRHLPPASQSGFEAILADFDVLFGRSKGEKWSESLAPAAFVSRLQRRIREALNDAARAGTESILLDRCCTALHSYLREFPLLTKTARVRELATAVSAAHPELRTTECEILDWLDKGRCWLSTVRKEDGLTCQAFTARLRAEAGEDAGAEVALQLLWLTSIVRPGRPEARLVDVDQVLQSTLELDETKCSDFRPLAAALLHAAQSGNALRVTAAANRLRAAVAGLPESWQVRRLRGALARLGGRQAREHAILDFCRELASRAGDAVSRRLRDWLDRDGCLGELQGPTVEEGRALRKKLRQAIDPTATPSPRGSLFRMLDLAIGTLVGDGLPGLTMESLCTVWTMCHGDPRWTKEVRDLADDLADAAWRVTQGWSEELNWSEVADVAARARKRVPHCADVPSAVRGELGLALGRLARGPRLKTSGGE